MDSNLIILIAFFPLSIHESQFHGYMCRLIRLPRWNMTRVTFQRCIMTPVKNWPVNSTWNHDPGHNSTLNHDPGTQFNLELRLRHYLTWSHLNVELLPWITFYVESCPELNSTLSHDLGLQFNLNCDLSSWPSHWYSCRLKLQEYANSGKEQVNW